jgi:hypothetical protein
MSWVPPDDVRSPIDRWQLESVVYDEGEGGFAVATGVWAAEPRLGVRWNGTEDQPLGTPQARNRATWLVVPPDYGLAIAQVVLLKSEASAQYVREGAAKALVSFLGKQAESDAI